MELYVLTGGSCSGKSSVLEELRSRGYLVIAETAREVLCSRRFDSFVDLEQCIFDAQLAKEESLCTSSGKVFLDRSLIDVLVYYEHFTHSRFPHSLDFRHRYQGVFLFERLPFVADGLRIESGDGEAQQLHGALISQYTFLGYTLVPVPLCSIQERADFIVGACRGKST